MSDEDAELITRRIEEAAARVAQTVRHIRQTGDLQFKGNVIEMIAVLVVLRYLDAEEGGVSANTTVTLVDEASP